MRGVSELEEATEGENDDGDNDADPIGDTSEADDDEDGEDGIIGEEISGEEFECSKEREHNLVFIFEEAFLGESSNTAIGLNRFVLGASTASPK